MIPTPSVDSGNAAPHHHSNLPLSTVILEIPVASQVLEIRPRGYRVGHGRVVAAGVAMRSSRFEEAGAAAGALA
jgi:hypothetical protein